MLACEHYLLIIMAWKVVWKDDFSKSRLLEGATEFHLTILGILIPASYQPNIYHPGHAIHPGPAFSTFIRLRQNTARLAAGMNGEVNRAEAHQSEPTSRRSGAMSRRKVGGWLAMAQFRLIPHRLRWGVSFQ